MRKLRILGRALMCSLSLFLFLLPAQARERTTLETLEISRVSVARVEKELGDGYYVSWEYQDAVNPAGQKTSGEIPEGAERLDLQTVEEAQAMLAFPVAELAYIPLNYEVLEVLVSDCPDGSIDDEVTVEYQKIAAPSFITLSQRYVGPEATMHLRTSMDISVLERARRSYVLLTDTSGEMPYFDLYWIEGDYAFFLTSSQLIEMVRVADGVNIRLQ